MPLTLALTRAERRSTNAIGAMYYVEEYDDDIYAKPAHVLVEVDLPEDRFDELVSFAKLGRLKLKASKTNNRFGAFYIRVKRKNQ